MLKRIRDETYAAQDRSRHEENTLGAVVFRPWGRSSRKRSTKSETQETNRRRRAIAALHSPSTVTASLTRSPHLIVRAQTEFDYLSESEADAPLYFGVQIDSSLLVTLPRLPNQADSIDHKIEKLPISVVNRDLAQANNAAAEASVNRIARALTWIRSFLAATARGEASG